MNIKEITEKDISSYEYLLSLPGAGGKVALQSACKSHKLTASFIREFKQYITKELFSLSPKLSYDLISSYPELFDATIWANGKNKSILPLKDKQFRESYNDDEIVSFITSANPYELDEDLFHALFDNCSNNIKKALLARYKGDLSEEFIIKNADLFNSNDILSNNAIASKLSGKILENLIKSKSEISIIDFLLLLMSVNDISWQERMCKEVESGKISNIKASSGVYDATTKVIVGKCHDIILGNILVLLKKYNPLALSYTVLEYILRTRDLTEETCLYILDEFKKANLVHSLGAYARENNYSAVLLALAY